MPRNIQLRQARDMHIRDRYRYLRKKNPRWSTTAIIEVVASEVFLSQVTIAKILTVDHPEVPTAPTISRYNKIKAIA